MDWVRRYHQLETELAQLVNGILPHPTSSLSVDTSTSQLIVKTSYLLSGPQKGKVTRLLLSQGFSEVLFSERLGVR